MVAFLLFPSGSCIFISRSFMPSGMLASFRTRIDLMAKPTPVSRRSSLRRPLQKKVYPPPVSVSWPLSAKRVSLSAAMSMTYRASSLATRAVRLPGLSALRLSSRVLTFHVARVSTFVFFFFSVLRPLGRDPRRPRYAGQGEVRPAIFRAPFLARPHPTEASRAILNRAARSLRRLPNPTAASIQWRTTICSMSPVCGFAATATSDSTTTASPFPHRHRALRDRRR